MFGEIAMRATKPRWEPTPDAPRTFTPGSKLMACNIISGPQAKGDALPSGLIAPQSMELTTPVLHVIAVAPDIDRYKAGDYILVPSTVTVYTVCYKGHTYAIVHENGVFGSIDAEHLPLDTVNAKLPHA